LFSMTFTRSTDRDTWDALSDDEVVRHVREGDTALYEILVRRYNQRLYRVARCILRDDAEAEDVMQDAYVRAYEHLGEFAGAAKFSTWLTRIAIHEALARVRKRARTQELEPIPASNLYMTARSPVTTENPERQAYDRELKVLLERAIDSLQEDYRSVFVMRIVEGLTIAETAACLDLTIETVKTRLHRGRALLRRHLQRRAGIVAPDVFPFHLSRCDRVVEAVFQRIHGAYPESAD